MSEADGAETREFVVEVDGESRKDTRALFEILHPEGAQGGWRDLPWLLRSSLRLVWEAGPRELVVTAALQLVVALGATVQLFVNKAVLTAVLRAGGNGHYAGLVAPLAALVAVTVAIEVAQTIERERSRVLSELVARRALGRVLDVSTRVDLLEFESPEFYDRLQRASAQGQFRSLQMVNGLVGLVGAAVAAVGLMGALTSIQPLLLPLLLAGYVPLWIVAARNSGDFYMFAFGMTPNDRARHYLQQVLTGRDPAKEVRAFRLAPFLRGRYERLYDERIAEARALARRRTLRSLVGSLTAAALTAGCVGALAWLYTSGRMSLAATGASVFALYQLSARLRGLHFSAAELYEATLFVRDYASFVEREPSARPAGVPAPPGFSRLTAESVTFAYPGTTRPAVAGVSLEIAAGEVVALVGENGSGKTTLAKMLAGLYRPQWGRIAWDGRDVAELDPDELRRSVAVIFQDFERYLLPARENIGLGRHERIEEREAIVAAALRSGADSFLSRLPEGYDTMLGREFWGGWDLSIGQWQRVALARAFFRDAPFVILDEPTAALDARAESELFERLRELLAGRAVVLISHRFSSVRSADRIYVLRTGEVVEHGSHEELLARGGLYAELFTLQAAAYTETAAAP